MAKAISRITRAATSHKTDDLPPLPLSREARELIALHYKCKTAHNESWRGRKSAREAAAERYQELGLAYTNLALEVTRRIVPDSPSKISRRGISRTDLATLAVLEYAGFFNIKDQFDRNCIGGRVRSGLQFALLGAAGIHPHARDNYRMRVPKAGARRA